MTNIDGYILNVYYKDMPSDIVEPGSISYDFESINLEENETSINSSDPGYPEGWDINVSSNGTKDMCTTSGDFNSGKQGINFDAAGDYILSPEAPAPIHKISFWIKPSNMDYESYNYSLVGIHVKDDSGKWTQIANIPNYWMSQNGGFYSMEGDEVGNYITQVKLTCEASYSVTFAIDDIQLDYATQPIAYPLIVDRFTTDTSYTVSDIDPSKEHYYNVKVKEGDLISEPTYDVWVDGINGVTPVAKPATEISETGFTANWEPLYNASHYKLAISKEYSTIADNEEVVLIEEDFSGLTEGTIESPNNPWTMTHNLADNNQSDNDWLLTNPQWANGMAGSTGTSWSGAAGLVLSPKMKLGNNTIKVDLTAYNTGIGDKLWVMAIEEYNSPNAIVGKTLDFSATEQGYMTGTVIFEDFDFGDKPVHIALMSQNGVGFFIDNVKITAIPASKGTVVESPYKVLLPTETYCKIEDLPYGIDTYKYNVIAKRTKDFVEYVSNQSETITVVLLSSSLNNVSTDTNLVYSINEALHIKTQKPANAKIYNIQGKLVISQDVCGECIIPIQKGIYIVRLNDSTYKVVVK